MISAIFDLQVTPLLPTKFQVNGPFGSGEAKNNVSRWPPSWISDQNVFSYFDLQDTPMLPTKFQVNWPFGSGEEAKNRFSRWWPSWIPDRSDFSLFLSTRGPREPFIAHLITSHLAFQFKRRSSILIFKMVAILDFQSEQF